MERIELAGTIWCATLEGFTAAVFPYEEREYMGTLKVWVTDTEEDLMEAVVPVAFNAIFGPFASDVVMWQTIALDCIESYQMMHPEPTDSECGGVGGREQ